MGLRPARVEYPAEWDFPCGVPDREEGFEGSKVTPYQGLSGEGWDQPGPRRGRTPEQGLLPRRSGGGAMDYLSLSLAGTLGHAPPISWPPPFLKLRPRPFP